ncbi:MAG TPA: hypothetical protein VF484_08545, partial [Candidatus Limnocylindrales bacterium]
MTLDPTQPTDSFQPAAPEPGPYQVPAQPVAVAKPKPPAGMTSWINIALGLALVIAVGGVAFAAGRLTAPATAAANGGNGRTFPGGGNFPGGG